MPNPLLSSAQIELHADIRARAIELGYDPAVIEPIYDGVVDVETYLATKPRIMWILKEPYADFDNKRNPIGGGWMMFRDVREGDTLAKSLNRNTALRNVAYASYALQSGTASYALLPWITDFPTGYERAVKSVAYANIGKMPGHKTTPADHLKKICAVWKDILFWQIDLYDPEVIIICGTDTLVALNTDFGFNLSKPAKSFTHGRAVVDVHNWRGKRIVWASHPAARISPEDWVNAIIASCR